MRFAATLCSPLTLALALVMAAGCSRSGSGAYHSSDDSFGSWTSFLQEGTPETRLRVMPRSAGEPALAELVSLQGRGVGRNKDIPYLRGKVSFEYRVTSTASGSENVFVVVIPIEARVPTENDKSLVIEAGASRPGDPANANSTRRVRFAVPKAHLGDGQWHQGQVAFDFTGIPRATFAIVGLRLNEGSGDPAPAHAYFREIRVEKIP